MTEILSNVIWPGWITRIFQDEASGAMSLFHECVTCGARIDGTSLKYPRRSNPFADHVRQKHVAEAINVEVYALRTAIHVLGGLHYGLKMYEWPN